MSTSVNVRSFETSNKIYCHVASSAGYMTERSYIRNATRQAITSSHNSVMSHIYPKWKDKCVEKSTELSKYYWLIFSLSARAAHICGSSLVILVLTPPYLFTLLPLCTQVSHTAEWERETSLLFGIQDS